MGICVILLGSGNSVGPIYSGFIGQGELSLAVQRRRLLTVYAATGWRWINWITVIAFGIIFVCVIFLFPETRFDRVYSDNLSTPNVTENTPGAAEKGSISGSSPPPVEHKESTLEFKQAASREPRSNSQTKASYIRGLSPWSGTAKHVGFWAFSFDRTP